MMGSEPAGSREVSDGNRAAIDVYDSPKECIFYPQKVEGLDAFSFSLDRHAVIHHDSVLFRELSSESRKVAMVGSAFEVTHEFSLEKRQIQGISGEFFSVQQTKYRIGNRVY